VPRSGTVFARQESHAQERLHVSLDQLLQAALAHARARGDFHRVSRTDVEQFQTRHLPLLTLVQPQRLTVLHGEATGDSRQEREADAFAAEFLTPTDSIHPLLPGRIAFPRLGDLSRTWGVSVHSLVYRCRELGVISDATASGPTRGCGSCTGGRDSARNRSADTQENNRYSWAGVRPRSP
jgi:hypothetical protein